MSVQEMLLDQVKHLKETNPSTYAEFITNLTAWRMGDASRKSIESHTAKLSSDLSKQEEVN